MRIRFSGERMDEAHFIGQLAQLRHQFGDHLARLSTRLKFPRALGEIALSALKSFQPLRTGHWLAMPLNEFRFIIKRIQLTACAQEQKITNTFLLSP